MSQERIGVWLRSFAVLPAIATGLLPGITCPCALPAYLGLLGSMGLTFLLHTGYLVPLAVVTLLVALGALGFRAQRRRGYGPLVVGLIAGVLVVVGKFGLELAVMTCGGIALLIVASVWNSWPLKEPGDRVTQLAIRKSDT